MYNKDGGNMRKISQKESEIANILNSKRINAYLDIYKETEFSGLGVLVDEELDVYKYYWNISFNKESHNFSTNTFLYKCRNKINYEELEKFLLKDLNVVENKYFNDSDIMEKCNEIIKLKSYVNEFFNKELYNSIKDKISMLIKEDL